MAATRALVDLAHLSTLGFEGDESVARALDILRESLNAGDVALVFGESDGFEAFSTTDLGLTQTALWLIHRDLTSNEGARGFSVRDGRVASFGPASAQQAFDHVAALIPSTAEAGQMVIARGDWAHGLSDSSAELLESCTPALALLLQRRLRRVEAGHNRDQLSSLINITRGISGEENLEQMLSDVARTIGMVADLQYVTIDLIDAAGDVRMRSVNYDRVESAASDRWLAAARRPDAARAQVLRSGRPVLFADAQRDDRLSPAARAFLARLLIRSTAVFPLIAKGETLGAMLLGSTRAIEWNAKDIALIEGLAAQVATAVKGIELYHELAESREKLAEKSALLEIALATEREHARRDSLTGVLNHGAIALWLEDLKAESARAVPFGIAMVDVDGMKATNDTYGHQIGDALLITLARALDRDGAIVGRYGGDEFLVALPGADRAAAETYRDDVLRELAGRQVGEFELGVRVPVAASIGLAVYPDEGEQVEDLIKLADAAMYGLRRERRAPRAPDDSQPLLQGDRAARLVGEIVPLLTAAGTREEKLNLVAQRLSVGASYDAVNFEVSGDRAQEPASWQRTFIRAPHQSVDAWVREQAQTDDHPLGRAMRRSLRPLFIDSLAGTDLLTPSERQMLVNIGLQSALVVPMIWHGQLVGMLSVASKRERPFTSLDAHFLTAVSSQVTAIVFMTTLVEELQVASADLSAAHSETVMMLAAAAEAHDQTTGRHLQRVRGIAEAIACELGYATDQADAIGVAAVLHDIGKIRVPDVVLASSTSLSADEWRLMKQHTIWGSDFLDGRRGFELATVVARCHHERWDGGGYPAGLRGDEIPEAALITSVADSFDAMTNDRPYRVGRPAHEAIEEIVSCTGTQFSPRVVDALVRLFGRDALPFVEHDEYRRAA